MLPIPLTFYLWFDNSTLFLQIDLHVAKTAKQCMWLDSLDLKQTCHKLKHTHKTHITVLYQQRNVCLNYNSACWPISRPFITITQPNKTKCCLCPLLIGGFLFVFGVGDFSTPPWKQQVWTCTAQRWLIVHGMTCCCSLSKLVFGPICYLRIEIRLTGNVT